MLPPCGGVAAGRKLFRAIARYVAKVPSAVAHRLGQALLRHALENVLRNRLLAA